MATPGPMAAFSVGGQEDLSGDGQRPLPSGGHRVTERDASAGRPVADRRVPGAANQ